MSISTMNVCIEASDLVQIVQSVFSTMVGLEIAPCSDPWSPDGNRVTSAVHLSGDWNGVVLLECERRQACAFAARFLSIGAPDTVDDTVRDVLGELANMIGGNLKCVVTRGISLSMPSVVDGGDYRMTFCRAELMLQCAFDSDDGVFWVSILTEPDKQQDCLKFAGVRDQRNAGFAGVPSAEANGESFDMTNVKERPSQ